MCENEVFMSLTKVLEIDLNHVYYDKTGKIGLEQIATPKLFPVTRNQVPEK